MSKQKNTTRLDDVIPKSAWYDPAWRKRKRISVPRDRFNGRVENLPLLVDLGNDARLVCYSKADIWNSVFTEIKYNINYEYFIFKQHVLD